MLGSSQQASVAKLAAPTGMSVSVVELSYVIRRKNTRLCLPQKDNGILACDMDACMGTTYGNHSAVLGCAFR